MEKFRNKEWLKQKTKRVGIRLSSYIMVGLFTTGGMWITWNILYYFGRMFDIDQNTVFSVTQYLASAIWIFPSFFINRKLTFKDKTISSSKTLTAGKVIAIYNAAPLLSSLATYLIQIVVGLDLDKMVIEMVILSRQVSIPYAYLGLQVVGIGLSLMLNFLGQYFLVYSAGKKPTT